MKSVRYLGLIRILIFLFSAGMFFPAETVAQSRSVNISGIRLEYAEVPFYDIRPQAMTAFVAVPYARADLITAYNWSAKERKGKIPYEIDFVYSKFPVDTTDWVNKYHPLMPNRLKNLFALDPELARRNIKWRIVAQYGCVNEAIAQNAFHGFVIRYRYGTDEPTPISENSEKNTLPAFPLKSEPNKSNPLTENPEKKEIAALVENREKVEYQTISEKTTSEPKNNFSEKKSESITGENLTKSEFSENSEKVNPAPIPEKTELPKKLSYADSLKKAENDFYYEDENIELAQGGSKKTKPAKKIEIITEKPTADTLKTFARPRMPYHGSDENLNDSPDPEVKFREFYSKRVEEEMKYVEEIIAGKQDLKDSVVMKVLDRHPEWKDMTVVMDWTGSMYPFGAQVVRWHELNLSKGLVKNLVVFNDGDDYSETSNRWFRKMKPLGKAGGIYYCNPKNLQDVLDVMKKTMSAGDGGPDLEENDIEACAKALEKYPETAGILLIADKDSYVRDIELLHRIKVPVHVILCGVKQGLEPDYLTIALHTKGGVYDINDDISFAEPEKVMRRQVIKIDKIKYVFNEETGRFELLPRKRFFPF